MNLATAVVTEGVATVFSANGDEIYLTYRGHVLPGIEPLTADPHYDASGGTGRFAGAEGEMEVRVEHPTPETWTSRGSGWIRYSAWDRAMR
jgi:hypothetical protein